MRKLYYNYSQGTLSPATFEELAVNRASPIDVPGNAEGVEYAFRTDDLKANLYDKMHAWFTLTYRKSLAAFLRDELRAICRKAPMLLRSREDLEDILHMMALDFCGPDFYVRMAPRHYLLIASRCLYVKVDSRSAKAAAFIDRDAAYCVVKVPKGSTWLREELAKELRFAALRPL